MDIKQFFQSKNINSFDRMELFPRGRTKYIVNASESYGVNIDPEKVVFIIDDTLFGSGKDGCIVTFHGIAFKPLLQKQTYFSFDNLSNIEVMGSKVIINDGEYSYDFSMIDESDVASIFECLIQWLDYQSEMDFDLNEYQEKVAFIKSIFKSEIMPLILAMVEESGVDEEEMEGGMCECIDDIKDLEAKILNNDLNSNDAIYIDNLIEIIEAMNDMAESGDFDVDLLKSHPLDRDFGKFLKAFLEPIISSIVKKTRISSLARRLEDF